MSDLPLSPKEIGRLESLRLEVAMAKCQGKAMRPISPQQAARLNEYITKLKRHTIYLINERIERNPVPRLAMRKPYIRLWDVYRVEAMNQMQLLLRRFSSEPEATAYIEGLMVGRVQVGSTGISVPTGLSQPVPTILTPETRAATLAAQQVRTADVSPGTKLFFSDDRPSQPNQPRPKPKPPRIEIL